MARESTFPADDVPDRGGEVLAVLREHDPVPVPMTALYLRIGDKRALAREFEQLEGEGRIERAVLHSGDPDYEQARALVEGSGAVPEGPIGVYRLAR